MIKKYWICLCYFFFCTVEKVFIFFLFFFSSSFILCTFVHLWGYFLLSIEINLIFNYKYEQSEKWMWEGKERKKNWLRARWHNCSRVFVEASWTVSWEKHSIVPFDPLTYYSNCWRRWGSLTWAFSYYFYFKSMSGIFTVARELKKKERERERTRGRILSFFISADGCKLFFRMDGMWEWSTESLHNWERGKSGGGFNLTRKRKNFAWEFNFRREFVFLFLFLSYYFVRVQLVMLRFALLSVFVVGLLYVVHY